MSTMFATTTPALHILSNSLDCRSLEMHQYAEWREWAMGSQRRLSQQDLMSDIVDAAHERHMYIPSRAAMQQSPPAPSAHLDNDEMVARVVTFFQNVHNNHVLRQLQLEEGGHDQPYQLGASSSSPGLPLHERQDNNSNSNPCLPTLYNTNDLPSNNNSNNNNDLCMPELGLSTSFLAEQEALWNRLKEQQEKKKAAAAVAPVIPEWLHDAARQEGRRIRVVTVDNNTDTRTVTCVGCQKKMLAASNVQIVFCPECGCTFSPEMLAAE